VKPEELREIQKTLKAAKEALETARKDLENMEKAGLDTTEERKRFRELEAQLAKMIAVYGVAP
jgi:predicted  nucleic acid-binding Zn-ribbon protein